MDHGLTFDFSEAIRRLQSGRRVRRAHWVYSYLQVTRSVIMFHASSELGAKITSWAASAEDRAATDWMIADV